jgi:hypothetical protein
MSMNTFSRIFRVDRSPIKYILHTFSVPDTEAYSAATAD